jgi:hypothetical protein
MPKIIIQDNIVLGKRFFSLIMQHTNQDPRIKMDKYSTMMKKFYFVLVGVLLSISGWAWDMRQGFVENKGQWAAMGRSVYFENTDRNIACRITSEGLEYEWVKQSAGKIQSERVVLRPIGGQVQKFERKGWISPVYYYQPQGEFTTASFESVVIKDVYPNIDWKIYTTEEGMKYDWILHAGADVKDIQMIWDGVKKLEAVNAGGLKISTNSGELEENAPISFCKGQTLPSSFVVRKNKVGFDVKGWDGASELTIDPEVIWSSYYGGEAFDEVNGISSDLDNNVFITGTTTSTSGIAGISSTGIMHQANINGTRDAFVAKFNENGQRLWATYYGGEGQDEGNTIAVDRFGFVYMAGTTTSNYAISSFGFQTTLSGIRDGYMVKFNTNGQRVWGSYIGGSASEGVLGMTIDNEDRLILLGETTSNDFPAFGNGDNIYGGQGDLFVTCINGVGSLYWSSYWGGEGAEYAGGIGYDIVSDNVYISGSTSSVTGIAFGTAQQPNFSGGTKDGLIASFDQLGAVQWSTYCGGMALDEVVDCSSDIYGNIYLVGTTASSAMATPGAYQLNYGGGLSDAFVAQYNEQGQMVWRSYFGGSAADEGSAIVADEIGNIYFGGQTASTGLSLNNPFQSALSGGTDVYFSKFTVEGAPQWITYYGGAGNEELAYLSVDQSQKILFAGSAASSFLSNNGWQASLNGGQDGWFGRIEDCPNPYVTIALDGEIEFCEGESVMMAAGGADSYVWNTGDTTAFLTIEESGMYFVRGLLDGCQGISVPIEVISKPVPTVEIIASGPTTICSGEILLELYPSISPDSLVAYWEWNDGTQSDIQFVEAEDTYSIDVIAINGCEESASVNVQYADVPDVLMALATDSICISASPLNMVGLPVGGEFINTNGTGIEGSQFNPAAAGGGAHFISYSYYDADTECLIETAPEFIDVLYAPVELFVADDTVCVFEPVVMLTGIPAGGFYTGIGVSGNQFYPSISGVGPHNVTYNYVDPQGCTNRAVRSIYVDACGTAVDELVQGDWKIYPNPSRDFVKISAKGWEQTGQLSVYSADGKRVYQGLLLGDVTLDVQNWASGVYSLRIQNNEKIEHHYFVKE